MPRLTHRLKSYTQQHTEQRKKKNKEIIEKRRAGCFQWGCRRRLRTGRWCLCTGALRSRPRARVADYLRAQGSGLRARLTMGGPHAPKFQRVSKERFEYGQFHCQVVKSKWRRKSPTLHSCAGSRQTCQMASCVMAKWYQVPGMICGARVVFGQTQLPSHSGRLGDSNGVCLGVQVDCLVTAASQARRTRHQRLSMLKLEQDQRKVSPLNASQ